MSNRWDDNRGGMRSYDGYDGGGYGNYRQNYNEENDTERYDSRRKNRDRDRRIRW